MKDIYQNQWLAHRQDRSIFSKPLKPKSIQEQIKALADLTPTELAECISNSINSGWQGLFPRKSRGAAKTPATTTPPVSPQTRRKLNEIII